MTTPSNDHSDINHGARPIEDSAPRTRGREMNPGRHPEGHHTPGGDNGAVSIGRTGGHLPEGRVSRVSWGAILAGVFTFLALTILLSIAAAAMGLAGASGTAAGIWTIITLAVALAAAGYVSGALAVRSGYLHGMLTWATSLVGIVIAVGWLGSSVLGSVGNAVGTAAQQAAGNDQVVAQVEQGVNDLQENVTEEDVDQAQQEAEQTAQEAADTASTGMWWTFGGLIVGGVIATLLGGVGAKAAQRKHEDETAGNNTVVVAPGSGR